MTVVRNAPGLAAERFAAAAARRPEHVAVRQEQHELTYRELAGRVDDLAVRLAGAQLRRGSVVAVDSADRLDHVVALLAVARAGCSYLPLVAGAPVARNRLIAADAGAVLTVTGSGLPDAPAPADPGRLPAAHPAQTAYVVYTSGTTGSPKGVAVSHAALADHLAEVGESFGITDRDVVLQFAAPGVDVAIEQVLLALGIGATLVLADPGLPAARDLLDLLDRERITVANLPAGYFHQLVVELDARPRVPATLRVMISGSDRLSAAAAATWRAVTGVRLLNAYGPTEAIVTATVADVSGASAVVPIGRAVGDRRAHVLDRGLRPCPDGVTGELYLGGGLADGYPGRAGLTAERFVPDPSGERPGNRLYRTGDLVRRRPDGELELAGRADDQVKIRGFRVELGEVENAVAAHPGVAACTVSMHQQDRRLAAYIIAGAAGAPDYPQLRDFLSRLLPDHLVPASLTVLKTLPLTPAGTVDRAALPEPTRPPAGAGPATGPTQVEELLGGIWAGVLGLGPVSVADNFFHLGGDSLTAVQVAGRVFEIFGPISPYAIFEAPTLGEFAASVTGQLATRGGLLADDDLCRRPRDGAVTVPLSRFQRGLWLLDQLDPGTATYNVPWLLTLRGPLDLGVLRRCLDLLVERHEVLRTGFSAEDGTPRQVVHEPAPMPFEIVEVSTADPARRAGRLAAVVAEHAARPFDLGTGTPLRAVAIRSGATETTLLLVLHHIVWDEQSLPVLTGELAELYEALSARRPHRLPDPAVQYADYCHWLERTDDAGPHLDYWAEHLDGAPVKPTLPTDRPRPLLRGSRGDHLELRLSPDLTRAVRELARAEAATPFMVLLAALASTIHDRGGADDMVIGTPVSVRNRPELQQLIGYFVNLLPLRLRLRTGTAFRDLLRQARSVVLGGLAHQDVPFEWIADRVLDERLPDRNPLFQVSFEMHSVTHGPDAIGPARLSHRLHVNPVSRFDLSWSVEDRGTELDCRIEYDTDLFDRTSVRSLADHWSLLLADVTRDPDRTARPGASAVRSTVREVGAAGRTLPALFREQVRAAPRTVALVSADIGLTYSELGAAVTRLARQLSALGVRPGSVSGIHLERGVELVVALLAVLEAGAGYTLLDPGFPAERLCGALDDAGASHLLTTSAVAGFCPAGVRTVWLDQLPAPDGPGGFAGPVVPDAAVACVMFTSGSTGRPKGVVASHRVLTSTYLNQDYAVFDPGEVWLQCSPVSWDAFALEVFGPLLSGGTCVLQPGGRPDPQAIVDLVARHGVTHLQLSASLFDFLVDEFVDVFEGLTVAYTGGEPASVPHVAELVRRFPRLRVVNGYGPVESMGFTTTHTVTAADLGGADLPIGRPVTGKDVYVLDGGLRPVPAGVVGELYAAGGGVAHGYATRPGLTGERFLPDPYGPPGARMYRTGDLGSRTADGVLRVAGRVDEQLKIRGFRVEPGEVRHAVLRHPAVDNCAVVGRRTANGDQQLVAYVVCGGAPPTESELRAHLARLLPEHLVPGAVVRLATLPLTANGKLDRAALPDPAGPDGPPRSPPASETERLVAEAWREVLGLDSVGLDDSFFRLGGNSLTAVRVAMQLSRRSGTRVPPRLVFQARTVRAMAERLDADCPPAVAP